MSGSIGGGWRSQHPRRGRTSTLFRETRGTEPARPTDDGRTSRLPYLLISDDSLDEYFGFEVRLCFGAVVVTRVAVVAVGRVL